MADNTVELPARSPPNGSSNPRDSESSSSSRTSSSMSTAVTNERAVGNVCVIERATLELLQSEVVRMEEEITNLSRQVNEKS